MIAGSINILTNLSPTTIMSRNFQETVPAASIVNNLLRLAAERGEKMHILKIQKLVVYCHGWHLGLTMRPLLREQVVAWGHGPLVESIHVQMLDLVDEHDRLIRPLATIGWTKSYSRAEVPADHPAMALIKSVWAQYGHYSEIQLANLCNQEGSPWHIAIRDAGLLGKKEIDGAPPTIPDFVFATYFAELAANAK